MSIYFVVSAFGRVASSPSRFLFFILSGIIQGCPLAGTCFAICMDTFLEKFGNTIDNLGRGIVRACADDIGAALRSLQSIIPLAKIFNEAQQHAGLTLKIRKCSFVVLSQQLSEQVVSEMKSWIIENVPSWSDVQIVDCARYLGAHLGPRSANDMWTGALAKWARRSATIASSGAPIKVCIETYHARSLTTLSYISQIAVLPMRACGQERSILGRLLHLPPNAFGASDFFSLSRWGSYQLKSALARSLATLMRSALVTHKSWVSMRQMLQATARLHLDIEQAYLLKKCAPRFWDSDSIAETLHDASLGFPNSKRFGKAGRAALDVYNSARIHSPRFPKGVESLMYDAIVEALYVDSIPQLLQRRARVLSLPVESFVNFDFEGLRESLVSSFKPFVIFSLFRTWSNGWTTSHRMHEPFLRPCLLGCRDCSDDLAHYVQCKRLWKALKTSLARASLSTPNTVISSPVLEKLALASPSAERVLHICAITHAYHVLKHSHRHLFYNYIAQGNVAQVANITIDVLHAAVLRFQAMI